jgi:hypothetical protein
MDNNKTNLEKKNCSNKLQANWIEKDSIQWQSKHKPSISNHDLNCISHRGGPDSNPGLVM